MIIKKEPTEEQRNSAIRVKERWDWENTKIHFKKEGSDVLFGIIAETIVSDITGSVRPESKNPGPDGGWDVVWNGKVWDVKTEFRNVKFKKVFNHNVNQEQITNHADGYIFVSYNRTNGEYEICGWITKEEFFKKSDLKKQGEDVIRTDGTSFKPQGKSGMYTILHKYIHEFKNENEMHPD